MKGDDPEQDHVAMRRTSFRRVMVITVAALWTTYLAAIIILVVRKPILHSESARLIWRSVLLLPASAVLRLVAGSTTSTVTARLYAASYAGTVTTLDLNLGGGLRTIASTNACGVRPSWLAVDHAEPYVYCLDEAWDQPSGTVKSFHAEEDGSLSLIDGVELIAGPVSIAEFGAGLAIASYAGSGVSVVGVGSNGHLDLIQNETYTLDRPGPVRDRQEAPHPHQALLDPTGAFMLVPDLGADLIRVYRVDEDDLTLTDIAPLKVAPGSGPRHGAFKTTEDATYLYVVTELANTIIGYDVRYNADDHTLEFSELFTIPIHGDGRALVATAAASEIQVTPDGDFLIVASRYENALCIENFDPNNSTEIVSDPLIVYAIDEETGLVDKIQEFPAGGSCPRHFSINSDGDLVAVGLQGDGRVVFIRRDVETGLLEDFVGFVDVMGGVSTVMFV
ncbi:putative isomerase YbhE [Xylaria sp. CBS 124048]|nr:putative isomerase YbhE [Xylaria sp. CBS 124048]